VEGTADAPREDPDAGAAGATPAPPGVLDEGRGRFGPPDVGLSILRRRVGVAFQTIARCRTIPVESIESIVSDLVSGGLVPGGRSLRSLGAPSPGDWLAAHSLLVAGLGLHLAEALGWKPGQVRKFVLGCLLHDVGMLFVPRRILIVPRPLTPSEREEVERHPGAGRELIERAAAWGVQIHQMAQDHHERWNGAGYPLRKREKEVDLAARMVAFLTEFAALISWRPHRQPYTPAEAIGIMAGLTERGLFDPAVLAHFRNIFVGIGYGSAVPSDPLAPPLDDVRDRPGIVRARALEGHPIAAAPSGRLPHLGTGRASGSGSPLGSYPSTTSPS
jgi:hypothetical protein